MDNSAKIEPGIGAAGFYLDQIYSSKLGRRKKLNDSNSEEFVDLGNVRLWLNNGRISQIGLVKDYSGTLEKQIGIGSKLSDVKDKYGDIIEDIEDNLILKNYPGVCFETEMWEGPSGYETVSDNLDKKSLKFMCIQLINRKST